MGDFYEMFLADAELAAPLLDIALTTRDKGRADPVPMCGIPVHSVDGYLRRLTELGLGSRSVSRWRTPGASGEGWSGATSWRS